MKEFLEPKNKEKTLTKFTNPNKTLFCICTCRNEVLLIDYDKEINAADLSIYTYPTTNMTFWQKIRYICRIIWVGYPYSDQIVLNTGQLSQIKQFIEQII